MFSYILFRQKIGQGKSLCSTTRVLLEVCTGQKNMQDDRVTLFFLIRIGAREEVQSCREVAEALGEEVVMQTPHLRRCGGH